MAVDIFSLLDGSFLRTIFLNFQHKFISWLFAEFVDSIGCHNKHWTHVTADKSTTNNLMFFFVSDLNIEYFNNY